MLMFGAGGVGQTSCKGIFIYFFAAHFQLSAIVAFCFVVSLNFYKSSRWSLPKNKLHKQTMHASYRCYLGRSVSVDPDIDRQWAVVFLTLGF